MIRLLTFTISIFFFASAFSQEKQTRKQYIEKYSGIAVREMNRSGVPASITLAQGSLESGNGNSTLAVKGNNHFGIKCHSSWTGKKMYHDDDKKGECFRVYKNADESFVDHSDFLVRGQRYDFLFDLKTTDYKGWAKGLRKAGYATNPQYADLLITIIEAEGLHLYDTGKKQIAQVTTPTIPKVDNTKTKISLGLKRKKGPITNAPNPKTSVPNLTQVAPSENKFDKNIYENNNRDYVILQDGETLFMLSAKFGIPVWKLYSFNDLEKTQLLNDGDVVYLEKKRGKAQSTYITHKVAEGETMQSISQLYGIKLSRLYKMNKRKADDVLEVGTNLYVRKNVIVN